MTAGRVLLLMGVPGIGKTTVIRRVAARLKGRRLGGFYTEEIREDGVRRGFGQETVEGNPAASQKTADAHHPKPIAFATIIGQ